MAVSNVAARRAAFNGVRAFSPCNHVSNDVTGRCSAGSPKAVTCSSPPCPAASCPPPPASPRLCLRDGFSRLLTRFAVAIALTRRHEAASHDPGLHDPASPAGPGLHDPALGRRAEAAWRALRHYAQALIDRDARTDEARAFIVLARVIAHLAALRGTHRARCFHHALMDDPTDLIGLFRHAASPRAHRLMAAGFNGIERLAQLRLFCAELTPAMPAAA